MNESYCNISQYNERDTIINIENLIATNYSDWIVANDSANVIICLDGDDIVSPELGND